jgi:hypothetical protein
MVKNCTYKKNKRGGYGRGPTNSYAGAFAGTAKYALNKSGRIVANTTTGTLNTVENVQLLVFNSSGKIIKTLHNSITAPLEAICFVLQVIGRIFHVVPVEYTRTIVELQKTSNEYIKSRLIQRAKRLFKRRMHLTVRTFNTVSQQCHIIMSNYYSKQSGLLDTLGCKHTRFERVISSNRKTCSENFNKAIQRLNKIREYFDEVKKRISELQQLCKLSNKEYYDKFKDMLSGNIQNKNLMSIYSDLCVARAAEVEEIRLSIHNDNPKLAGLLADYTSEIDYLRSLAIAESSAEGSTESSAEGSAEGSVNPLITQQKTRREIIKSMMSNIFQSSKKTPNNNDIGIRES